MNPLSISILRRPADGFDVTRLIKSENKNLPIIAQTAYATSSDIESCRNAGCDDILVKPINKNELLRKIAKWIS